MRSLTLATVLLLLATRAIAADGPPKLGELAPALKAGEPEAVLPGGALIHIRLAKLDATLDAIDGILAATVPEAALPPQALAAAVPPKRMLSLIAALASHGGAPAAPAIIAMSGLDLQRPITLTWYAQGFPGSWVLSIPVKDPALLENVLMGALQPIDCEPIAVHDRACWHLECSNPSLPTELFIIRSPDRVYLVSPAAGQQPDFFAPTTLLGADPVIAALPAGDIAVALCAAPFKQVLPMIAAQAAQIGPQNLAPLRRQLMGAISPSVRANIDARLQARFGITFDELVDYAECLAEATASTAVPSIAQALQGFDGVGIGIGLARDAISAHLDVRAAGIETLSREPLPQPLPMAALGAVPFQPMSVALCGRSRVDAASPLFDAWSTAVLAKLSQRGLQPAIIGALISYLHDEQRVPSLADAAPWSLMAMGSIPDVVPAQKTFAAWSKLAMQMVGVDTPVTVLPLPGPDPLIAHLTAAAAAANGNYQRWTERMEPFLGAGWIDRRDAFRAEPQPGAPTRLVSESCYTTRSGLFGCSQHELINRVMWQCRERGGMLVLQQMVGDRPTVLASIGDTPSSIAPALADLAKHVDAGSDTAMFMRLMPVLPALLGNLSAIEASEHNEIDGYLAQAHVAITTATAAHPGSLRAARAAIARLPMPLLVERLVRTADGDIRCVLPFHLGYPRPLVSALVKDLLASALAHVDEEGGMCMSSRAQPGVYSMSAHFDLRGCERLIHEAGNQVATRFLTKPDQAHAVLDAIGTPADGERAVGETLAVNPIWMGMESGIMGMGEEIERF